MNNPFELLESKLSNIESLLLNLNQQHQEPSTKNQLERLLTVQQAADFLGLKVQTIYSKVSKGELPFMKKSKRLYFSNLELLNYIKDNRTKTNSELDSLADSYLSNF